MRRAALLCVLLAALALPASAFAHAALLRTVPSASVTVNSSPKQVQLVYSEAVEPRFAIVSVTDANATSETTGPPTRDPANADQLDVPLKHLSQGWYLVVWRVISVDGHPVRGAFTFAVGPNAGPAPQFKIPSLSETAATPKLITARWAVFISFMAAIGLFVLRMFVARPLRSPPRALSIAFWIALVVALIATPVYVLLATAEFAVRSFWSWGALIPLLRTSAFGRGYLDLELVLALFAVAAAVAFWVDRPDRDRRSIAELLATGGALAAAAAAAFVPGVAGHAAQTSPRALAVPLDGLHVLSGSLWVGGLLGLLVVWGSLGAQKRLAGLAMCVPRFSNVALTSVIVLFGSGVAASVLRLPTLASLWQTSYGQAIIVKAAILLGAIFVASFNLFKTVPGLRSPVPPPSVAALLRGLVSAEVLLVAAAVAVAAVLSSLPPPPKALAAIGRATAHTGPGRVAEVLSAHGYQLQIGVNPNRAAVPNEFALRLSKNGRPVTGATVTATFTMLDMEMQSQIYKLSESSPGLYEHSAPALVMVGHWGISYGVSPPGGTPFNVLIEDRANG
jgi:copper transport protein